MRTRTKHIVAATVAVVGVATAVVLNTPHHIGPAYLYPDPALTPGLVATQDITLLTATNPTYSQTHRLTTQSQKDASCNEYSTNCKVVHEADHFCPLALGCADDIKNLWAQPETNLWNGANYGFHEKDKLETYLVLQMKAGNIAPKDAQDCILKDWVKCYQIYIAKTPSFGSVDSVVDTDDL